MEVPPPIATSYQSASVDYTLDEFVEFNLQLYAPQIRSENITFIALGIIGVIGFVWALAASERLVAILSLTTAIWFLGRTLLKKEMIKSAAKKIHDNPSSWLRTKRTVALSTEGVKSMGEDGSYNFTP